MFKRFTAFALSLALIMIFSFVTVFADTENEPAVLNKAADSLQLTSESGQEIENISSDEPIIDEKIYNWADYSTIDEIFDESVPIIMPAAVPQTITFAAAGGTQTFDAGGIIHDIKKSGSWITVSAATTKVTVTASKNTGSSRSGSVTVVFGSYSSTATVTQSAATVTITWNANGGSVSPTSVSKTIGSSMGTLPTPTRTGYSFNGWYTSSSGGSKISSSTTVPSSNTTYYAQWSAGTVTITWNANGGTVSPPSSSKTVGSTMGTLPTPTRTGYSFNGWFTSASGGSQISSSTTVPTVSTTYYAHWTPGTVTITWNANGGSVSPTSSSKTVGSTMGTLPTPTRTGYTFNGWYTSSSGGTQISSSTTVPSTSATYYAQWTASTITITWNANGGTVSPTSAAKTFGSTLGTLPTPTRTGYSFDGWYTSASGGTKISSSTAVPATNTTYYAHWIAGTVTITWNANGGTVSPPSSSKTVGSAMGTLPTPTRTGYTFNGWYTSASGGTQITSSTTVPSTNTTYYAHWTGNTVTITWNPSGGSVSPASSSKTVGSTMGTLPTPTRTGYTFNGWYTSASGGTQITSSTTVPTASTTYYAHWTGSTVTITWNANGGSVSPTSASKTVGSTMGTLPTPTRTGYTFDGWYTSASGGTKISSSTTVPAINTTYYAHWTATSLPAPSLSHSFSDLTGSVTLTWTSVSGATGYSIYDKNGSLVASTTALTYKISGLKSNTSYSFTVKAYNASGFSPASSKASFTTGNAAIFNPPGRLKIYAGPGIEIPDNIPLVGGMKVYMYFDDFPVKWEIVGDKAKMTINTGLSLKNYMGVRANGTISVQSEGTIVNGKLQILKGTGTLKVSVGKRDVVRLNFMIGPVPCEFMLGLDLSSQLSGPINVSLASNDITPDSNMSLSLKVTPRFGVGNSDLLVAGIYGELRGTHTRMFKQRYNTFNLGGSVGAYVSALAGILDLRYEHTFVSGTLYEYGWSDSGSRAAAASNDSPVYVERSAEMFDLTNYDVSSRDYLTSQSAWLGESGKAMQAFSLESSSSTVKALQTSVASGTKPLLAEAGGNRVMVFLSDDGSRDPGNPTSLNRNKLVYSVYDDANDTWSAPQAVWNTDAADYYPDIYSDGDNMFVTWNKCNTVITGETSPENIFNSLEIAVAKFDPTTKTFTNAAMITNNGTPDILPQIAADGENAFVSWVALGSGDIFGTKAANTVMYSDYSMEKWNAPKTVASGLNAVVDIDAGYVDGSASIAYIMDKNNDLTSFDDRDLYVSTAFSSPKSVADDDVVSNPSYDYINGKRSLTWCQNGEIFYSNSPSFTPVAFFDEPREDLSDDYKIVSNASGDMAVIMPTSDGIYGFLRDENGWGESIELLKADDNDYIRCPDAVFESDGGIYFAFKQEHVTETEDGFTSISDLCVYKFIPSSNIRLNEVVFSHSDVKAGTSLPIALDITNAGSKTVTDFSVVVSDGTDVVDSFTVSEMLLPGKSAMFESDFYVPDDLTKNTVYTVMVLPLDGADADESDNSCAITLGYVDLGVELESYELEDEYLTFATVTNYSGFPVADAKLVIHEDSEDGPVVKSIPIGALDGFDTIEVDVRLTKDDINYDGIGSKILFFEIISGEEEMMTFNNTDFVVLSQITDSAGSFLSGTFTSWNPKAETTIKLLKDEQVVDTIFVSDSSGAVMQEQAFTFKNVLPGNYSLEFSKPNHLKYTIHNIEAGYSDVDLANDLRGGVNNILFRCGDIDGDGTINQADLNILWSSANYLKSVDEAADRRADLDGDGAINQADLNILWSSANYLKGEVVVN